MSTLEIIKTGPLALLEDLGRPGLAHMGVTRSGAAAAASSEALAPSEVPPTTAASTPR